MRPIDADTLWRKMEDSPWNDNADRDLAQEMVLSMPILTTPTIGHCKDCDSCAYTAPRVQYDRRRWCTGSARMVHPFR